MQIEILPTAADVAKAGAEFIARAARSAVAQRGRFVLAVSGGTTPWVMLKELAATDMPWANVHIVQVDERIAPEGHADRNVTQLRESLAGTPLPMANLHPMPVNDPDLDAAAGRYAAQLQQLLGPARSLDVCHLGLGPDGHTASLVPGDPTLGVRDRDVAITGLYQKRLRMTLTYPILDRSQAILWVVTGANKVDAFEKLREADPSIPAAHVLRDRATVLADREATGAA